LSTSGKIQKKHALFTIVLAIIFWYITFGLKLINFWYSMGIAASILATLAVIFNGKPFKREEINVRNITVGIVSAIILYGVFWLGNFLSSLMFDFAPHQVGNIYDIRTESQLWFITFVLLFITSPAEEIFWRGFLQRWVTQNKGKTLGWIYGALIYGGVHVISGNFMLTMAALVAGLFWGYLFMKGESVVTLIVSHAVWTTIIFVFFPIM